MARIVHLACARCGHSEMFLVESAGNNEAVEEIEHGSGRLIADEGASTTAASREQRLQSLPTSLPVGGIITPV